MRDLIGHGGLRRSLEVVLRHPDSGEVLRGGSVLRERCHGMRNAA